LTVPDLSDPPRLAEHRSFVRVGTFLRLCLFRRATWPMQPASYAACP
jgi:hypothetical protein